ncbi:MAG TPA: UDP-N-acetylglucosamine 2-epimerase (non-hydrolyzing) [Bacteroidales bacterium]|nr:UDP-N-acetylglucosamine 2-epimerase (non-hydrolyzing) [Bacteroidales bacterium]
MKRTKVITVVGTRPEIIRLSRVMSMLDVHTDHIIAHTGQNYDYELNEIFYRDLELRKPDFYLNVDVSSLEASVGDIIRKSGELLRRERPDALLVLGDTNSCLSAYMAKRLHIPIFHMEAGNRCYDFNVPEEINRRLIDHMADFNLVYTEHARRHLISEGLPHRRIYLTGSPMFEVLNYYASKTDSSGILQELSLSKGKYFVVSAHREENVDSPSNLILIMDVLNRLAGEYKLPVIVSTHPRTRKRLEEMKDRVNDSLIQFLKPFGFSDYIQLQKNSLCTVSDSGTISEESSILNFAAISLRNSMERPEAQDTGTIVLTGLVPEDVMRSVELVIYEKNTGIEREIPADYKVSNTSWRVLKLIQGLSPLSNRWHGITR